MLVISMVMGDSLVSILSNFQGISFILISVFNNIYGI
jgi:hypothetical protein